MDSGLCEHCTGVCCKYVALPIETPETRRDYDDIRWYLMHEGMQVFVEEGAWYIQFATPCRSLQPDNLCRIHATRPQICREYTTKDCDYHGGAYRYEHLFTEPEQIEAYAKQIFRKKKKPKTAARAKAATGTSKVVRRKAG